MRLRQRFVLLAWRRVALLHVKQRSWVEQRDSRLDLRAKRATVTAWRAITRQAMALRKVHVDWFWARFSFNFCESPCRL